MKKKDMQIPDKDVTLTNIPVKFVKTTSTMLYF